MFWLAGVFQPLTVVKFTVCCPVMTLLIVAPLLCGAPPSRFHFAPASIAPCGAIVTCTEPVCRTYVPVAAVVWFGLIVMLWLVGVFQSAIVVKFTVWVPTRI